jgi:hypothetical protein
MAISMAVIFYGRNLAHGIRTRRTEGQIMEHGIMSIAARILQENKKKYL